MRVLTAACLNAIFLLSWVSSANATSPWVTEKGHVEVSTIFISEEFDQFYKGKVKTDFPPSNPKQKFKQKTSITTIEVGVLDGVSIDLGLGYVRAHGSPIETNDGMADTTLGIKFQILDEFEWDCPLVPTLAFRFGGIFDGTYSADVAHFPGLPGDDASGIEGDFAFAKLLPPFDIGIPVDIGLAANLGIRLRNKGVPTEWHARTSVFMTLAELVTVSVAYDQWKATSGIDIGGPDWNPSRFRELKEITKNIEAGIGMNIKKVYLGFFFIRTLDGRNTGIRESFGASLSVPFELF